MSAPGVRITYDCGETDLGALGDTYVTFVPLEIGIPFPRALKRAVEEAGQRLTLSIGRDILGLDTSQLDLAPRGGEAQPS